MSYWIKYACLLTLLLLLIAIGLFAGPSNLGAKEILGSLVTSGNEGFSDTIIWSIRLPRIAVSLVAGACLGLAGVLIQLSTRSPFGDPNLFGIGGGATIFIAFTLTGIVAIGPLGTFTGSIAASTIVALLLSKLVSSKDLSPIKLAVIGIAIGALSVSIGTSVMSHGRIFPTQVIGLLAGSFTASTWEIFWYSFMTLVTCFVVSIWMSNKFLPIMLGDIVSRSLGVNPIRVRTIAMAIAGILTGAAVYSGGLIAFVGLISPHITRRLLSNSPSHLVIGSTTIGAIATLGSDQLSRLLFAPAELPVGMTTTIVGALLMIYLALKMK